MSTRTSKVVEIRPTAFVEVRAASVHSPGQRLTGSRNEVWLCPAYSGSDTAMLYVKPKLPVRQFVSELIGAQLGIALGLPCPAPYIVSVAPHLIGGERGPARLTFGSRQVGSTFVVRNRALMLE